MAAVVGGVLSATLSSTRSPSHSLPAFTTAAFTSDNGFGRSGATITPGSGGATGVAVIPSGVTAAGSIMVSGTDKTHFQVARYTAAGALDTAFGGGITNLLSGGANAVTVIPAGLTGAGDIVAAGYQTGNTCGSSNPIPIVAEYLPDGTLNASFGTGGVAAVPCPTNGGILNGVTIDPTGQIDVAGEAFGPAGADMMLVASFPPNGLAVSWTPQSLLLGGTGASASAIAFDVATGDLVAAGWVRDAGGQHLALAAVTREGALDTSFAGSKGYESIATAGSSASGVTALPNGNVITAGTNSPNNGRFLLAAFSKTGSPLGGFGSAGQVSNSPALNAVAGFTSVAYQTSNNLLSAAGFVGTGTAEQVVISQYNATTGALNKSFGVQGYIRRAFGSPRIPSASSLAAVAVQPDGKTVAAGEGPVLNDVPGLLVMRAFGPVLSVGNTAIYKVHTATPVRVLFPVTLSEPLPVSVLARFCASGGGNVNGQGHCGNLFVHAGVTSFPVPVVAPITVPVGHAEFIKLTAVSINGLAANPAKATGVAQIQRLQPPPPYKGYWMVASDGGIFNFGTTHFFGSTGNVHLNQPIVGMAVTPRGDGYWLVASDGGIFAFGKARFFGSTGNVHLNQPIVGMAATPDGRGYWLVASDGGIFSFGDARFHGSTGNVHLNQPIVGMAATPDGLGYWMVASDGGIFAFGDATFHGSTGNVHLTKPIVGMAAYPGAGGYWMVASDGGIFAFGAAAFHGSTGNVALTKPIVGMAATFDGAGYWLVASDGGIFAFGHARFFGSTGNVTLTKPIVGMTGA